MRKMRIGDAKEPQAAPLKSVPETCDIKEIAGWLVKWRPWVYFPNQDAMCGAWFAYPPNLSGCGFYSAYPGQCGPIWPGQVIDCSLQDWQSLPTCMSSEEDLLLFKQECLEKLTEKLWIIGKPPYDPRVRFQAEVA